MGNASKNKYLIILLIFASMFLALGIAGTIWGAVALVNYLTPPRYTSSFPEGEMYTFIIVFSAIITLASVPGFVISLRALLHGKSGQAVSEEVAADCAVPNNKGKTALSIISFVAAILLLSANIQYVVLTARTLSTTSGMPLDYVLTLVFYIGVSIIAIAGLVIHIMDFARTAHMRRTQSETGTMAYAGIKWKRTVFISSIVMLALFVLLSPMVVVSLMNIPYLLKS